MTEISLKTASELMLEFAARLPRYEVTIAPIAQEGALRWRTIVKSVHGRDNCRTLLDSVSNEKWLDGVVKVIEADQ